MYCMIKTCMEDKGISRLVNAPIPSQPEQTLPSKMGKPIVHLIAQKPCKCASFRRWETRSSSTDTWNSQINSSPSLGSLVLLFLSPWHSCDQGLHCRQEYALFPILILQRNYWVRKCLWIDAGAMTRPLWGDDPWETEHWDLMLGLHRTGGLPHSQNQPPKAILDFSLWYVSSLLWCVVRDI